MTKEEAIIRIEEIYNIRHDDEVAHMKEDSLRNDFLIAISEGKYSSVENIKELSKIVLRSNNIDFSRWCA